MLQRSTYVLQFTVSKAINLFVFYYTLEESIFLLLN